MALGFAFAWTAEAAVPTSARFHTNNKKGQLITLALFTFCCDYQTRQALALTMRCPALQPKA